MKFIAIAFCLLFWGNTAFAVSYKDSLYHVYIASYKHEKTGTGNFMEAIFSTSVKTISIENDLTRRAIAELGKPDTTGIRLLTEYIIGKFVDEQLMNLECADNYAPFEAALKYYTEAECACIDANAKAAAKEPKARFNAAIIAQRCMEDISKDAGLMKEMRAMVPDVVKFSQMGHCSTVYMHVHCRYLKAGIVENCVHQNYKAYKELEGKQNRELMEAITMLLTGEKNYELRKYFTTDVLYGQKEKELLAVARQMASLKMKASDVQYTTAFTKAGDQRTTFVYAGGKHSVICQLVLGRDWTPGHELIIKSMLVIPADKVKSKEEYLKAMDATDTPPPMKELGK